MIKSVQNKEQLIFLLIKNKEIIKAYGVKTLGVFGSFVRNEQKASSDIDLIVEFHPEKKSYKNFIGLIFYLEELFGRKVELLTPKSMSPYIEPYIMEEVEYVSFAS